MAEKSKKRRVIKKTETVRQQAEKAKVVKKPRRIKKTISKVSNPIKSASRIGRKEYYLPVPDNRLGKFLNKRRRLMPKYFREAWAELRQVTWPSRRETLRLTLAVFMFALIFGGLVWIVDFGLENLFRKVLID